MAKGTINLCPDQQALSTSILTSYLMDKIACIFI